MADDSRIDDILGAWRERRDRGEDVPPEAVIREHPDLADSLRARFRALSMLEGAAGDAQLRRSHALRTLPLDRYTDFKPAGEGGMGIVYWAIDTDLNREVAFKVIRPDVGDDEPMATTPQAPIGLSPPKRDTPASQAFETLKARFLQEAWVTGGLSHPGIVPVYELGQTPEGVPYYTMRFVKGKRTLKDAIEAVRGQGIEERLALLEPFLKVCDAISYAHARGVIHRDLKPENVALGEFGEVVVLDWGLAKLRDRPDVAIDRWQDQVKAYREAADLRTVASAMGTPGYMAPEAARGDAASMDERSDVYSLGALLFQILTGRLPHEFETYGEFLQKTLTEDAPKASMIQPTVPMDLSALCGRCLARETEERPKDAGALAQALRAWQAQSASDREVEALLNEARGALGAAASISGDALLAQVERATLALRRMQSIRPDDAGAREVAAQIALLRARGLKERDRSAARRVLVRVGFAALVLGAGAAIVVAGIVDARRQEAESARRETAALLVGARAVGLAAASRDAVAVDPTRALLLAAAATRTRETRDGAAALRTALRASHERSLFVVSLEGLGGATFSADGTRFLVACNDGTARVFDLDGRMLASLPGHQNWVDSAVFSPDGTRILTLDAQGTPRLWDERGHLLQVLSDAPGARAGSLPQFIAPPPHWGVRATFSPHGGRIAVLKTDGAALVWDLHGKHVATLPDDGTYPAEGRPFRQEDTLCFSPDGRSLLVLLEGGRTRLWNLATGIATVVEAPSEGEHWSSGTFLEMAPHGLVLLLGSTSQVAVRRLSGETIKAFPITTTPGAHVEVGPRGVVMTVAAVPRQDGPGVEMWSLGGERVASFHGHRAPVQSLARSADGRYAVTASEDGTARVWGLPAGRTTTAGFVLRGHHSAVSSAVFSPDATRILTASLDGTVRLWDVAAQEPRTIRAKDGSVEGSGRVAFTDGGRGVVVVSEGGELTVWPKDGRPKVRAERVEMDVLAVSPDGTRVLTAGASESTAGSAHLLDLEGIVVASLEGHTQAITDARFARDGSTIVTASEDATVRVWDLQGRQIALLEGRDNSGARAELSPSGRQVLALTDDGAARLYDLRGTLLATFDGEEQGDVVDDIAFASRGDRILTRSMRGTIRVWDPTGKGLVAVRPGSGAQSAVLSGDGQRILVGCEDSTARIFDLEGKELLVLRGHEGAVTQAIFSPDGSTILTVSADQTVRIWDDVGSEGIVLEDGTEIGNVCFSPDGRLVAASTPGGGALVWHVRTDDLLRMAEQRAPHDLSDAERKRYGGLVGAPGR